MKQERNLENQYCQPMSIGINEKGELEFCELQFQRGGNTFIIQVATPSYIEALKEHNSALPEELQLDDNIYPMEGKFTQEEICQKLSQLPLETLESYLTKLPHPENRVKE